MKYTCEKCGQPFDSERECKKHEEAHALEELKKTVPEGAIICPTCDGTGDTTGTDGCDVRTCYTCKGKRFVIPKTSVKTIYNPID